MGLNGFHDGQSQHDACESKGLGDSGSTRRCFSLLPIPRGEPPSSIHMHQFLIRMSRSHLRAYRTTGIPAARGAFPREQVHLPIMNAHHLHKETSTSDLTGAGKNLNSSVVRSRSTEKGRLISRIHKLVRPSDSGVFGHKSHPSPGGTTASPAASPADAFKMVHEPDKVASYSPSRPMNPRTESQCEEALKEMFAQAEGEKEGGNLGKEARSRSMSLPSQAHVTVVEGRDYKASKQEEPSWPLPPHDVWPMPPQNTAGPQPPGHQRTPPPPAPRDGVAPPIFIRTKLQMLPAPRTAEARLETIPGSPATPATMRSTMRSMMTPVGASSPMTPGTPRTTDSSGVQRVISGESARAPQPLSQRAFISRDGKSKARVSRGEVAQSPSASPYTSSPVSVAQSPLASPYRSSPVSVVFPSRPEYNSIPKTMKPVKKAPAPSRNMADWEERELRGHVGSSSVRADGEADGSGEEERITPAMLSEKRYFQRPRVEGAGSPRAPAPASPRTKRRPRPEPCHKGPRLCDNCRAWYRPNEQDFEDSDSDYEDNEVKISSLSSPSAHSPRRTQTPRTTPQLNTHTTSSPRTVSPIKVAPSPPARMSSSPSLWTVSSASPARSETSSALYHLERRMLSKGGEGRGREVIRVGSVHSGEGLVVVHPDDDDDAEEDDMMKIWAGEGEAVDAEGWAWERKHAAGGSDLGWFSYPAEEMRDAARYVFDV